MPNEIEILILVIVIISVVVISSLIVIKSKSNQQTNYNKNPKNKYLDRKIRKFANDRDFLFLSDVFLPVKDNKAIIIDNIIFGNKYIYVISQKHWDGHLKGYEYDTKWMITSKSQTKYVDNPLINNRFKVQTLLNFLKEKDENTIINIIAINDHTKFNDFQVQPLENVIKMSKLFKLIDDYEKSSPLNDIKEDEIERIANLINNESNRIKESQARV